MAIFWRGIIRGGNLESTSELFIEHRINGWQSRIHARGVAIFQTSNYDCSKAVGQHITEARSLRTSKRLKTSLNWLRKQTSGTKFRFMDDHGRTKVLLKLIESPSKWLPLEFCIANLLTSQTCILKLSPLKLPSLKYFIANSWVSQTCINIVTLKIAAFKISLLRFHGVPSHALKLPPLKFLLNAFSWGSQMCIEIATLKTTNLEIFLLQIRGLPRRVLKLSPSKWPPLNLKNVYCVFFRPRFRGVPSRALY